MCVAEAGRSPAWAGEIERGSMIRLLWLCFATIQAKKSPAARAAGAAEAGCQAAQEAGDGAARFRFEIREQLGMARLDVLANAPVEGFAAGSEAQAKGAAVGGVLAAPDVALLLKGGGDAARGALVEPQLGRELVEHQRAAAVEDLEAIALAHRDVVAADPLAVAELRHPQQLLQRVVERSRIRGQLGGRIGSWVGGERGCQAGNRGGVRRGRQVGCRAGRRERRPIKIGGG